MNKHTPGPWKHESIEDCWWVTAPSKEFGDEIVAVFGGGAINVQNAHLIAAAPDLLAAAIEMLAAGENSVNSCGDDVAAMLRWAAADRALKAAISKATGETK